MTAHLTRLIASLGLVLTVSAIPAATVNACSCAFLGYPEAIAEADVAFVGVVRGEDEPGDPFLGGTEDARYAFEIERSKSPMTSPTEVTTVFGDGGNCGLNMDVGQRWLIIARAEDGVRSDLCTGSTMLDGLEVELQEQVLASLTVTPEAAAESESAAEPPPWELVAVVAAAALVAAVSVVAFRSDRVS